MGCSPTSPSLHLHKIVETCAYLELMNCDTSMKPTHETNENDFQKSLKGWSTGHIVFGCIWGVDTIFIHFQQSCSPQKNTQSGAGKSAELQSNSFRYGHHADSSPSSRSTATANASSASSRPAVERWLAAEKVKLWMSNMAIWIKIIGNTSSTAQGGGGSFKNRKPIGEVGCCESRMAERS